MQEDDFYEKLEEELKENWRKHREVLINDSYLPHTLLAKNLDGFTEFILENPSKLTSQLIDDIIITYCSSITDDYNYYKILRLVPMIMEYDEYNFFLIHDSFKDEQFTKVSYKANPEVKKHFDKLQNIYVSDSFIDKLICSLLRGFKFFKASLKHD